MASLTSMPTLVLSPFIIVTIGDYTFGMPERTQLGNIVGLTFPNFVKQVSISKVSGEVNQYTISMEYQIEAGLDPNLLDKVFSSVSDTRTLTLSYGDWAMPASIYKEEVLLISNVTESFNFSDSCIEYQITAVSTAAMNNAMTFNWPAIEHIKPSDKIMQILRANTGAIKSAFPGMANMSKVISNNLIATDDAAVDISGLALNSAILYIAYLVNCMKPSNGKGFYKLAIFDDNKNDLGGPYFKVVKVSASNAVKTNSNSTGLAQDCYEIDIGYPGDNFITDFSISLNDLWSILYNYNNKLNIKLYLYKINKDGTMSKVETPALTRSSTLLTATAADTAWWELMTSFPISASISLKGLVRPSTIVDYVKLNVIMYGQRHITSGIYIITAEQDLIDDSGYSTTLTLLRVSGDS